MYKFAVVVLALAATAFAETVVKTGTPFVQQTPLTYTSGVYPQYSQYAQYPQYAQYSGLNAYPYQQGALAYQHGAYAALPYTAGVMPAASYMNTYPLQQTVYQKSAVVAAPAVVASPAAYTYPLHQQAVYQKSAVVATPAAYSYTGYPAVASPAFVKSADFETKYPATAYLKRSTDEEKTQEYYA